MGNGNRAPNSEHENGATHQFLTNSQRFVLPGNSTKRIRYSLAILIFVPLVVPPPISAADARPDLIIVQSTAAGPGRITQALSCGTRLARLAPSDPTPRSLTPGFFAAMDPRTSFDGARVLFAGKKAADASWQIWEMNVDGTGARQVTHGGGNCVKPAYLARGFIVYTMLSAETLSRTTPRTTGDAQSAARTACLPGSGSQLWVGKLDGSEAHPITFGPGDFRVETVLNNGLILATARSPLLPSNGQPADRELYTLRLDGTGLATLRCDHQHPAIRRQAQELDDGAVVFVKTSLTSQSGGGQLAWIPRGALHNSPLTAPPVLTTLPQPLSGDQLIVVARKPQTVRGHDQSRRSGRLTLPREGSAQSFTRIVTSPS